MADCELDEFVDAACAAGALDRGTLLRRAEAFGGPSGAAARQAREPNGGGAPAIVGTYACYSHAWSPYFRGHLIRGVLTVAPADGGRGLVAAYAERLPTGEMRVEGPVTLAERALHLNLRAPSGGGARLVFCLFPPTPPATVLGGLMCRATIIGPEPQPSVTRIAMLRLPAPDAVRAAADAYLPPGASVAADLAELGLPFAEPGAVDGTLTAFLGSGGAGHGLDQAPAAAFRTLVELIDRRWLADPAAPPPTTARG